LSVNYADTFWQLIRAPFDRAELVWGIVPLYFSWAFAEFTGEKPNFKTAIQTGFNLLWAGAQWTWPYALKFNREQMDLGALLVVNVMVTILTITLGALAMYSGLRRRFPKYCSFLGHSRFSSYFTITMFPIQANYPGIDWTWDRLFAILIFALPTWLLLGLLRRGLSALRSARRKRA
jgi:hypothetical protein